MRSSTRHARRAVLVLVSCLASSSAWAQGELTQWSFTASARIAETSNLLFVPGGSEDTVGALVLTLGYTRVRRSNSFAASLWTIANGYREFDVFDGVRGGVLLGGTYAFSPTSKLRYGQSLATGFNPQRLYGTGEFLPQVKVTTSVTSLDYSDALTRSTTVNVGGDATWLHYRSDLNVSSTQLAVDTFPEQAAAGNADQQLPSEFGIPLDSSLSTLHLATVEGFRTDLFDLLTYRAGGGLAHEFGERTQGKLQLDYRGSHYGNGSSAPYADAGLVEAGLSVGRKLDSTANLSLAYTFQHSTRGPDVVTHTLSGQFAKELSDHWHLDASLGGSWYESDLSRESGWSLVGGAGVSVRGKRGGAHLRYDRSLYQALGFGRVVTTDFFYAVGTLTPRKRVSLGAYAGWRDTQDEVQNSFSFSDTFAGIYGSVQVHKRTALGLDYSFRRYRLGNGPAASASVVGIFATYSKLWK